jgi:hypothetical protein
MADMIAGRKTRDQRRSFSRSHFPDKRPYPALPRDSTHPCRDSLSLDFVLFVDVDKG